MKTTTELALDHLAVAIQESRVATPESISLVEELAIDLGRLNAMISDDRNRRQALANPSNASAFYRVCLSLAMHGIRLATEGQPIVPYDPLIGQPEEKVTILPYVTYTIDGLTELLCKHISAYWMSTYGSPCYNVGEYICDFRRHLLAKAYGSGDTKRSHVTNLLYDHLMNMLVGTPSIKRAQVNPNQCKGSSKPGLHLHHIATTMAQELIEGKDD